MCDQDGDLFSRDIRALHPLQMAGAQRLEQHVAHAEQSLGSVHVEDDARIGLAGDCEGDPRGDIGLYHAGDDVGRGLWVATTRWIPTARDFCASRITQSSTSCGETIIRSANSSMTMSM